jgi:hypothetical protein
MNLRIMPNDRMTLGRVANGEIMLLHVGVPGDLPLVGETASPIVARPYNASAGLWPKNETTLLII